MNDADNAPGPSQTSASFLRRLAGPSIMKAGLAKDQTEINKIIAEASKGSKFYENERRKDKELSEKITRILKERDELLREADLAKIERNVDQIIAKMEEQRDLSQFIVHVDMDAFYASVELLDNPSLAGKPYAVGHGVLTTASYEARKHGVRSGMPEFIAKKLCPELIVVSNHFPRYMELSKQVMDIFRRYDPNMSPAGCDEGYLNITKYCEDNALAAADCVQDMRDTVCRETKLTVSAGIAPNKMLAKICSDKNKPNGQFMLDFTSEAVRAFTKDLSIRKIPGVGRVNERLLEAIGIKTCGDIYTYRATAFLMDKYFGLHFLLQTYLGIASNAVEPGKREERKSIGSERTFHTLGEKDKIMAKLEEVAAELEEDMQRTGWTGKTVTLKYKLDNFQVFTRAKSFDKWISTKKEDLFAIGKELLMPELPLKLRLIGLRVTKLKDLRLDADSKANGIKRFFESASTSISPRKKRKLNSGASHDDDLRLSQDGFEESMPNYHEDAEDDQVGDLYAHDSETTEAVLASKNEDKGPESLAEPTRRSKTPIPKPSSTAGAAQCEARPTRPRRPSSAATPMKSTSNKTPQDDNSDGVQPQTCPLCGKVWDTDNQGLNEHIDFCLSKGAILAAQSMASTSDSGKLKLKPDSSVARKSSFKTKKSVKKR